MEIFILQQEILWWSFLDYAYKYIGYFFKKNYDFFMKIVALVSIPHPSGDNDNNKMIYIFNFRSTTSLILTISIYVHIHGGKMMTK